VTPERVRSTTAATVSAATRGARLVEIAALGVQGPSTWGRDNARSRQGARVLNLAQRVAIPRVFRPSYAPERNLRERRWKVSKNQVRYGPPDATCLACRAARAGCRAKMPTEHREKLQSWMTPKFQTLNQASFLAA
jgi:hypothetical protein